LPSLALEDEKLMEIFAEWHRYCAPDGFRCIDAEISDAVWKTLLPFMTTALTLDFTRCSWANSALKKFEQADLAFESATFAYNQIGPEGIARLLTPNSKWVERLTSGNFSMMNLNDKGCTLLAKQLERAPKLLHLDLRWNEIHVDGAVAISKLLSDDVCSCLATIDLAGNQIGNAGANALIPCFTHAALESVNLSMNHISSKVLNVLTEFVSTEKEKADASRKSLHLNFEWNTIDKEKEVKTFAEHIASSVNDPPKCREIHIDFSNNEMLDLDPFLISEWSKRRVKI
jgi:Ran GTPase-activating protein (RanGAP) involved in mRNA processing and transport